MEGQAYRCSWRKAGERFEVWVKSRPRIRASGNSFTEADQELWGRICEACGDGENVREYDPPPPTPPAAERFLSPSIVNVVGNTHSDVETPEEQLFTGGLCNECGKGIGGRTATGLSVGSIESGYDGAFTNEGPQVFSEAFVALLSNAERAAFELRKVERGSRARKNFYELIPQQLVPFVVVKGLNFRLTKCPACERFRGLNYFEDDFHIHEFVCREDLPRPLPTCFAIGSAYSYYCCMTRERWRELIGQKGTSGLVSNDVGVVGSSNLDMKPLVFRWKWGFPIFSWN